MGIEHTALLLQRGYLTFTAACTELALNRRPQAANTVITGEVLMQDYDASGDSAEFRPQMGLSRRQFGALTVGAGVSAILPPANAAVTKEQAITPDPGRNAALFRQIIERGFMQGDLTVADEICSPKLIEHQYLLPRNVPGPELMKNDILLTRKTVQELVLTIEDIVESGDKVWVRTLCKGVESRTGKRFVMDSFDVCRFEHGKIVEHWGVPDRFAMLHQVGLIPSSLA